VGYHPDPPRHGFGKVHIVVGEFVRLGGDDLQHAAALVPHAQRHGENGLGAQPLPEPDRNLGIVLGPARAVRDTLLKDLDIIAAVGDGHPVKAKPLLEPGHRSVARSNRRQGVNGHVVQEGVHLVGVQGLGDQLACLIEALHWEFEQVG